MTVKGHRAFLLGKIIMSGLVSKPKTVKPSPPPAPLAVPEVGEEVGVQARRKRPRGFKETFLTGDLIPVLEEKKERLG